MDKYLSRHEWAYPLTAGVVAVGLMSVITVLSQTALP